MYRFIVLALSVTLAAVTSAGEVDVDVDVDLAEAEAAFVFARLKAERLAECHDGQCIPAVHAAEAAFGQLRSQRIIPQPPVLVPPKKAECCDTSKCVCTANQCGRADCPSLAKAAPKSAAPAVLEIPATIPASLNGCRYVTINGRTVQVCPNR